MQAVLRQRGRFGAGEHLARVGDPERIKRRVQPVQAGDFLGVEHLGQILPLSY